MNPLLRVAPIAALLVAAAAPAPAATGLYGELGTLGIGLGAEFIPTPQFGLRADVNALNLSHRLNSDDATYDTRLKLRDVALLADYHPTSGSFRLSAGALLSHSKLDGSQVASTSGSVTINGNTYPVASGDSVQAEAKFPSVRPYLGLGWGASAATRGLYFAGDLGVAYGRPTVTLTASAALTALPGAGADLAREQADLQSKIDGARFWPVVRFGVGYAF